MIPYCNMKNREAKITSQVSMSVEDVFVLTRSGLKMVSLLAKC